MNDQHRNLLRTNRVFLVRNTTVNEELLSFLTAKRIISEDMAEENKHGNVTKAQKAGALLDLLQRRGPQAFRGFIEGLVETDQGFVADKIDQATADRYREEQGRPRDDTYPENTPVQRYTPREQSKNEKVTDTEVFIQFEIQTVDNLDGVRKNKDKDANYSMKSKPRGVCVILNIDKFSREANQKDRYGSEMDVVNVTELFKNLSFKVELWANPTKEKLVELIKAERSEEHHKDHDAFVMVILSHGNEGIIYAHDGKQLRIIEDIVNQFNGLNCKHLIDKPKLFFIQACQGIEKTTGVMVADGETEADAKAVEDYMKEIEEGDDSGDSAKLDRLMTHEQSDIYIAYATVPGYKAWRHTALGSWFMRDLVTVFARYCHIWHVADMMTEVNRLVDGRKVENAQYRQICRLVSQLRRRVFLLPGYYEN